MRIFVVALLAIMLTLTGCTGTQSADDGDAPVQVVKIDAANMRFTPDVIEVPVGTRLEIELTNTDGMIHDLVLANGVAGTHLAPGESEKIDVGVITEDVEGWCSISNHRAMGMTLTIVATTAE